MRKDLITNTMMPKKELVRIVVDKEKNIFVDPTRLEFRRVLFRSGVCRQFSTAELSHIMGKNRKILAVTDSGFAKAIMKKINEGE